MKYGFCTGFAADPLFSINSSLEAAVYSWGFDFIEYPLMTLAALSEVEFTRLIERRDENHLTSDCVCNLFPASVPVIGARRDEAQIKDYLETAFERAKRLGVKKMIFGSAGARRLGEYSREKADEEFLRCLGALNDFCTRYQMKVLIEAVRKGEADYINTLEEAAAFVSEARKRNYRNIGLMADLFHMHSNQEPTESLKNNLPLIEHVHVCEAERALPDSCFSPYMSECFRILSENRYSDTVSYESICPVNTEQGIDCRKMLKTAIDPQSLLL